uniref:TPR_REGION domain-containing protein n=1 Tax=Panagrellus redivivus TaxID=6233 RepID=A0A7E4VB82_PANRE
MAQEYYEEMRQCAMKLPGDITFGDLELNRLATCSLAETYMELRDFRSAALFFDDLSGYFIPNCRLGTLFRRFGQH